MVIIRLEYRLKYNFEPQGIPQCTCTDVFIVSPFQLPSSAPPAVERPPVQQNTELGMFTKSIKSYFGK